MIRFLNAWPLFTEELIADAEVNCEVNHLLRITDSIT